MVGEEKGGITRAIASRKIMTLGIFITPQANIDIDEKFNYIAHILRVFWFTIQIDLT
jgi:hypothetical protein